MCETFKYSSIQVGQEGFYNTTFKNYNIILIPYFIPIISNHSFQNLDCIELSRLENLDCIELSRLGNLLVLVEYLNR